MPLLKAARLGAAARGSSQQAEPTPHSVTKLEGFVTSGMDAALGMPPDMRARNRRELHARQGGKRMVFQYLYSSKCGNVLGPWAGGGDRRPESSGGMA